MKKPAVLIAIAVVVTALSCSKNAVTSPEGSSYLELPAQVDKYYPTSVFEWKEKNNRATLGRVLFYDTHLSQNNTVSCGSCHKQTIGFADDVALSRGFEGKLTSRNSPGISGLQAKGALFWDARERDLANLVARPLTNHVEMGIDDLSTLPAKLESLPYYKDLFKQAYGDSAITITRLSQAIAEFIQAIGFTMQGRISTAQLSATEQQGRTLFHTKYNCASCHFTGNGYNGGAMLADIGLDATYTDKGLGNITGKAADEGLFKVPSLINVMLTAPYMHDGRFRTMDEVLNHYSHGINNSVNLAAELRDSMTHEAMQMSITEEDKKAITAFLATLTDYETATDPKFSNPFKTK